MAIDRNAGLTVVRIRTPRSTLILPFLIAGLFLTSATPTWTGGDQIGLAPFWLAGAGVMVATSLWTLTWGIDLTPESADLRGVRRRSIPWQEVQAVISHEQLGSRTVQLIPEHGRPVQLRAPTSTLGMGRAAYERDFHRIGQWWLAHRGESWRPIRPEAPQLPVQE